MIIDIEESGMIFPVEEDNTFLIEKSDPVSKKRGLKSVEYVELRKWKSGSSLRFVEAKTTTPNFSNNENNNKEKLDEYIHDIREKFQNSISILFSSLSKRNGLKDVFDNLPANIQSVNYKNIDCVLWLVVKNSETEWLIPVLEILKSELKPMLKCWNIRDSNVKVVNEDTARENNLIK
ncbi:MAG: hypothetical protein U0K66_11695 [Paludibacteraceae bacterium]|jgi:hypothetical protein|nr:hypothetical protein [Paludibacteraceae bacterium]